MTYTIRPISDRTWFRPPAQRRSSEFIANYGDTLAFLEREIDALEGRNIVLEVDVPESGIRKDGRGVLSDARSSSPAVVVAFESRKYGPQLHRCDSHIRGPLTKVIKGRPVRKMEHDWQHNLRAIALTLEALRAVTRYGAAETGQQYTGFRAIGGARPTGSATVATDGMSCATAEQILLAYSKLPEAPEGNWKIVYRRAQGETHPDKHYGSRKDWDVVETAAAVLGLVG